MTSEWERGFAAGFNAALQRPEDFPLRIASMKGSLDASSVKMFTKKKKRKQSGKQKILTQMAKKAWDKYKKGNGKKSYIDIRAQVSRSQAYKKKTKGM